MNASQICPLYLMGTEPVLHPITSWRKHLHVEDSGRTVYVEGALRFGLATFVHLHHFSCLTSSRMTVGCQTCVCLGVAVWGRSGFDESRVLGAQWLSQLQPL